MITRKMLENQIKTITCLNNWPTEVWVTNERNLSKSQIDALYLDHNPIYGGYALKQIVNELGSENQVYGHCAASEMYAFLRGWVKGLYKN